MRSQGMFIGQTLGRELPDRDAEWRLVAHPLVRLGTASISSRSAAAKLGVPAGAPR